MSASHLLRLQGPQPATDPIGSNSSLEIRHLKNFIKSVLLYLQKRSVKSLCLVTETVDEETKKYLCRSYKIVGEPQKIEIDEEGIVRQIGNFQNLLTYTAKGK